jgi:hypothetical protein
VRGTKQTKIANVFLLFNQLQNYGFGSIYDSDDFEYYDDLEDRVMCSPNKIRKLAIYGVTLPKLVKQIKQTNVEPNDSRNNIDDNAQI